ncbi:MAG: DNA gyrase inhibitor YacG [Gammaproteobacteria bacterium]
MKEFSSPPRSVKCPTCSVKVVWAAEQRWRPFCSERCRLIDLGKWFEESNRLPADKAVPANIESPE